MLKIMLIIVTHRRMPLLMIKCNTWYLVVSKIRTIPGIYSEWDKSNNTNACTVLLYMDFLVRLQVMSFYRGLLSPVLGYGTMFAISFSAYGHAGRFLLRRVNVDAISWSCIIIINSRLMLCLDLISWCCILMLYLEVIAWYYILMLYNVLMLHRLLHRNKSHYYIYSMTHVIISLFSQPVPS